MPLRASHLFQQPIIKTDPNSGPASFTVAAGNTLKRGDPVYHIAATNEVALADAAALATSAWIGVVDDDSVRLAGEQVAVRLVGIVPGAFAGFTPGGDIWLKVGGGLTQNLSFGNNEVIAIVGTADSATDLVLYSGLPELIEV